MSNTTKPLKILVPNSLWSKTYVKFPWFIQCNQICCYNRSGVLISLFGPIPHQNEIVEQHNINLLTGISDEQYNLLVSTNDPDRESLPESSVDIQG